MYWSSGVGGIVNFIGNGMKRGWWLLGLISIVGMIVMDIDPFPLFIFLIVCTMIR